ncbi:MAG: endopeptidase La [Clostridia bacterium]|nr:endopeptidase La [Clostridia bacterium]
MTQNDSLVPNIPVLPLRGIVVFPKMMLHIDVGRKKSINAIKHAMNNDQLVFASAQFDASVSNPDVNDLYQIGVISRVVQVIKQPDNTVRVVLEGLYRASVQFVVENKSYLCADVAPVAEMNCTDEVTELALTRALKSVFEKYVELNSKLPSDIMFKVGLCNNCGDLSDFLAGNILLDYRNKQTVLEILSAKKRTESLIRMLNNELLVLELEHEINDRTRANLDQTQREIFLREEIRAIQEELGDTEDPDFEAENLREAIKEKKMGEEIEKILLKECTKLDRMPYGSQEAAVIRTYIDTCLELPWHVFTEENIDLSKVREALDKKHYGLEKVKDRIIEYLAVRKLNPQSKGNIICLVGPPGVGKTSIALSVAEDINRKSVRISLGGVKDEAEIRGHRRTYIGSMPGRIMAGMKKAGSMNPLVVLDEIDKLSNDYKGDPTSALLEVLDGEQNSTFVDHYLDIPFDLSDVMFITTANDLSSISEPLRDRMDVIELSSYTREEKFNIAKKHLIKRQLSNNGLAAKSFKITDSAVYALIDKYTREAGVRSLERIISKLMRKAAVSVVNDDVCVRINATNLSEYLGPAKYTGDYYSEKDQIGVANGLAWTAVGGEILPIEVAVMDGTGKLELTGSLGDVMQESAKTAVTCIRSRAKSLGIDPDFYKNKDIHIHAPEGAVPKDGPSAGITMATAICSALTSSKVRCDVAMTGEITLRGRVLPIGGLKEKAIAAYKSGIRQVIIPEKNVPDIAEIDPVVRENVKFIPVDSIDEVLNMMLIKNVKKVSSSKSTRKQPSADKIASVN